MLAGLSLLEMVFTVVTILRLLIQHGSLLGDSTMLMGILLSVVAVHNPEVPASSPAQVLVFLASFHLHVLDLRRVRFY